MELYSLGRVLELEPALRRGWTYPKVTKDWASKRWAKAPMLGALAAMRQRLPGLAAEKLPKMGVEAMWVYHPLVTARLARITRARRGRADRLDRRRPREDAPPGRARRRRHLLQRPAPLRAPAWPSATPYASRRSTARDRPRHRLPGRQEELVDAHRERGVSEQALVRRRSTPSVARSSVDPVAGRGRSQPKRGRPPGSKSPAERGGSRRRCRPSAARPRASPGARTAEAGVARRSAPAAAVPSLALDLQAGRQPAAVARPRGPCRGTSGRRRSRGRRGPSASPLGARSTARCL